MPPDYLNPPPVITFSPNPVILPGVFHVQLSSNSTPLNTTGSVKFDFSVIDKELDFLRQGEVRIQDFIVTVTDHNDGESTVKTIHVKITGANDTPTANVDLKSISENAVTLKQGVLGNDTDADLGDTKQLVTSSVFSVKSVADPYLTKAMVKAVNVNFLNDALPAKDAIQLTFDKAFQGLAAGEKALIVVKYTMVDGFGATSASELRVTVIGSNDTNIVGTSHKDPFLYGEKNADKIFALAGNDTVFPRGGNDIVRLGAGKDTVVFDTKLNPLTNNDVIIDFNHAADTIKLSHKIFTQLHVGVLGAGHFSIGAHAADADDFIVYNNLTGALIYDSNGNAFGGEVQFATLANHAAIANNDFVVI
jgi:VCBS repeat-containing protein